VIEVQHGAVGLALAWTSLGHCLRVKVRENHDVRLVRNVLDRLQKSLIVKLSLQVRTHMTSLYSMHIYLVVKFTYKVCAPSAKAAYTFQPDASAPPFHCLLDTRASLELLGIAQGTRDLRMDSRLGPPEAL
jgi:hypothetical protein